MGQVSRKIGPNSLFFTSLLTESLNNSKTTLCLAPTASALPGPRVRGKGTSSFISIQTLVTCLIKGSVNHVPKVILDSYFSTCAVLQSVASFAVDCRRCAKFKRILVLFPKFFMV